VELLADLGFDAFAELDLFVCCVSAERCLLARERWWYGVDEVVL
jgi:hypothetical protein